MTIENQVCTAEQAEILFDLGIKNDNYQYAFVDFSTDEGQETVLCRPATDAEERHNEWAWFVVGSYSKKIEAEIAEGSLNADGGVYAAYTVAELGMMIGKNYNLPKVNAEGLWDGANPGFFKHKTEAGARAAQLIDLVTYGAETAEEVNSRLTSK